MIMLSDKTKQFIKIHTNRYSNELGSVESKYGKRVISYREWIDPENAVSACEIEREEVLRDVTIWIKTNLSQFDITDANSRIRHKERVSYGGGHSQRCDSAPSELANEDKEGSRTAVFILKIEIYEEEYKK